MPDQGLLADIIGRDLGQVGLGDLDKIAEDFIEAHFERADPRPVPFPLFQAGDIRFARMADPTQVVELGVVSVLNDPPLVQKKSRLVHNGPAYEFDQVLSVVPSPGDILQRRRGENLEVHTQGGQGLERFF